MLKLIKICQITGKFLPDSLLWMFWAISQIKVHRPIDKVDNSHCDNKWPLPGILDCKVNHQILSNFCMPPLPHPQKYETENENIVNLVQDKIYLSLGSINVSLF